MHDAAMRFVETARLMPTGFSKQGDLLLTAELDRRNRLRRLCTAGPRPTLNAKRGRLALAGRTQCRRSVWSWVMID